MSKKISKVIPLFAVFGIFSLLVYPILPPVFAVTQDINFQVNVQEVLSVTVTTPEDWAQGNIDTLLTNKIGVSVLSNNADGFTATMMTSTDNASLINNAKSTATISTLDKDYTRAQFPSDMWGYSLNDNDSGLDSSTYSRLTGPSNPITIISNDESLGANGANKTTSKDIYFGAKASIAKASGTYSSTIVINVVSGAINNNNPVIPENPATPIASGDTNPVYDQTNNRTVRTTRSSSGGTTATTTDVYSGDALSSLSNPAGVTEETESNISDNSSLMTGIAAAAAVAAVAGTGFLIFARRRNEDDEEDY